MPVNTIILLTLDINLMFEAYLMISILVATCCPSPI